LIGKSVEEAVLMIRGERGTEVVLSIFRDGLDNPQDFKIIRDQIIVPSVSWRMIDNDIAYLRIYNFSGTNMLVNFYLNAYAIALNNPKGIILDVRNNPGGYFDFAVDIAGWFIKKGDVVVLEKDAEGTITTYRSEGMGAFANIPTVVLADEGSASASEIVAGALRDINKSKIVGQKTFGKGTVQELFNVDSGAMVKLTVAEWLTPSGISISQNGLNPDYEVKLKEGIGLYEEGAEDTQLIKAISVLRSEL